MIIEKYKNTDIFPYIEICSRDYRHHNVFSKKDREIISYLKKKDFRNKGAGLFIAKEAGAVLGGVLIEIKGKYESHARFRLNHLAGSVKQELLDFSIKHIKRMIGKEIRSAKVEVLMAETEDDTQFYIENGFRKEGNLSSHYRKGEHVTVLGMEL
jgi:hypothetical protein